MFQLDRGGSPHYLPDSSREGELHKIYKVTNTVNGKIYIGKTSETVEKRWNRHVWFATKGRDIYFSNAIRKYDEDAFIIEVIAEAETDEWSSYLERMWILLLESANRKIGYNSTYGGEGFATGDKNPNRLNPRRGKQIWNFGKSLSPEIREKISKSLMGKGAGENNPFYGKSHTPEMIRFFSESQKGKKTKPCSSETKEKISKSQIGMVFSEERKRNMSAAKLGTTQSEEQKANSVISQKVRRERELAVKYSLKVENGLYTVHHLESGVIVSGHDRKKVLETANRKVKAALDPNRARRGSPEHKAKLTLAAQKRRERERKEKAA